MVSGTTIAAASRASTTSPFWRRKLPSSTSERVTSSTKNGLPSAFAAMSACASAGSFAPPSSAPEIAATSVAASGWSVTRRW